MIVGVLGAGQLGRMLALAGIPLGLRFRFFDPTPDAPAGQVAKQIVGSYDSRAALDRFAKGLTCATYEFENVPVNAAQYVAGRVPTFPALDALEVAQDRFTEKTFFTKLDIPTPPFAPVDTWADLQAACAQIGPPAVLKTRRGGYDGKGQWMIHTLEEAAAAWQAAKGQPLILEGFVPFTRELSILAVRGWDGASAYYPLVENTHRAGILRRSLAPAPGMTPALQAQAESYAARVLDALGYVGMLAIELFQVGETLLVNEMAPRVHNSGHWTIEGATTSQFANHLRAGLRLPLGATDARGVSVMFNLIGTLPDPAAVLVVPGAHLHLYGKQPRPGRKLGHLTLTAPDTATLTRRLGWLEQQFPGPGNLFSIT